MAEEIVNCQHVIDMAQRDLDESLRDLEDANKATITAINSLDKTSIQEMKSFCKPPEMVKVVMDTVLILQQMDPTWREAKKLLANRDFIKRLVNFDKDNISDDVLDRLGQYCTRPEFHPDAIKKISLAACSLCIWVRAMERYGRYHRLVQSKKNVLSEALVKANTN